VLDGEAANPVLVLDRMAIDKTKLEMRLTRELPKLPKAILIPPPARSFRLSHALDTRLFSFVDFF
jgi:hypothetical protein